MWTLSRSLSVLLFVLHVSIFLVTILLVSFENTSQLYALALLLHTTMHSLLQNKQGIDIHTRMHAHHTPASYSSQFSHSIRHWGTNTPSLEYQPKHKQLHTSPPMTLIFPSTCQPTLSHTFLIPAKLSVNPSFFSPYKLAKLFKWI